MNAPTHSLSHRTVLFDPTALAEIITMDDFYKATNVMDIITAGDITDVQQIWMNHQQCLDVNGLCKANARRSKRHRRKGWRWIEQAVAMDWLSYSPVSVPYVPVNEIWIWSTEDYKTAMDEYRQWNSQNKKEELSL